MRHMFFVLGFVGAITATVRGAEHRLFGDHYLDVGNQWSYTTRLYMLNGQPIDLTGSASIAVVGNSNVSGYDVKVIETTSPWGGHTVYSYMSADFISKVGEVDGDITESLQSNDPLEMYPLWVDEAWTNYHFGHGEFQGSIEGSTYTWSRTYDTYVTYLGQEDVVVAAGTFSCVKALVEVGYVDSDSEQFVSSETTWIDPHIGIVKQDVHEWIRYIDGSEDEAGYVFELTSTNVQPRPYCKVRSVPMDFTGDCKVNLADFAVFLEKWLDCELDPPEACWE